MNDEEVFEYTIERGCSDSGYTSGNGIGVDAPARLDGDGENVENEMSMYLAYFSTGFGYEMYDDFDMTSGTGKENVFCDGYVMWAGISADDVVYFDALETLSS